jgi:hypothetical protein
MNSIPLTRGQRPGQVSVRQVVVSDEVNRPQIRAGAEMSEQPGQRPGRFNLTRWRQTLNIGLRPAIRGADGEHMPRRAPQELDVIEPSEPFEQDVDDVVPLG